MKIKEKLKEDGITLVALIITIIILIILAAVSIYALFKADFIGIATNGTINYAEAQVNEQKQTEELDLYLKDALLKIAQNNKSGSGESTSPTPEPTPTPTPEPPPIDAEKDIGKYVDYVPTEGTYGAENLTNYSGSSNNSAFTTDTNLKWRIFKLDNNTLYLISDTISSKSLYLKGYDGYNNGVKLLNDICNACYSNSSYSKMSARSLNIHDIGEVMEEYKWQYPKDANYGKRLYTYENANYPSIWALLDNSSEEDPMTIRSTQEDWVTGKESGSIKPMGTYWNNGTFDTSYWKNSKYQELIIGYNDYWLSSREIYADEGSCWFGLQYVAYNGLGGKSLYRENEQENERYLRIRPLVIIPLSSCVITVRRR